MYDFSFFCKMTLPVFRCLRSKRPRGRGVYTLSDTALPDNYIFKDRSRNPERVVDDKDTIVEETQITKITALKPTKQLRPVKFETVEDLGIVQNETFLEGLAASQDTDKQFQWRYVQNNIHKLLQERNIKFTPASVSWDGVTEVDGKQLYADIKFLGNISPHTPTGEKMYKALQQGWVRLSKNQSNKLRKRDGLGIDPVIYAYVILNHPDKTKEHKIFKLCDKDPDPTKLDQDMPGKFIKTPIQSSRKRTRFSDESDVREQLFV